MDDANIDAFIENTGDDGMLEKLKEICKAVTDLGCDSVQIFATRLRTNGDTANFNVGRGNWFARFGMAKMWCDDVVKGGLGEDRKNEPFA